MDPHSQTKENVSNFLVAFLAKCQAELSEDQVKTKSVNHHITETNTNCLPAVLSSLHPPQLSAETRLRSQRDLIEGNTRFAPVPRTAARKLWNLCGEKARNSYPLPKASRSLRAGRADLVTFSSLGPTGRAASNNNICRSVFQTL